MSRVARVATVLATLATLPPAIAHAERPPGFCVDVGVDFTPADNLQIVGWVEDAAGHYVDTVYITRKTGRFGLGNRPGRFDFNSGNPAKDNWPYGRRITTFPVWAHRHGKSFPTVVFQNGDENNLSHPFNQSSREQQPPYCRPTEPDEAGWDTGTCASAVYTDKGTLSMAEPSLYPPRADLTRDVRNDSVAVDMYRVLNPFDAVTQATPAGGAAARISWAAPRSVDAGAYTMYLEVSREYDTNDFYTVAKYPSPTGIPWSNYGLPYRGQPSVVYAVPFTIGQTQTEAHADSYVGYGDPDGKDGAVRPPDSTISTTTPGSGAARLQLVSDAGAMFRVRVTSTPELDEMPPAAASSLTAMAVGATSAEVSFVAPGDDGTTGTVTSYDVRVLAGGDLTEADFDQAMPVTAVVKPVAAGMTQTLQIDGLLPETTYSIGVRAKDNCENVGPLAVTKLTTSEATAGEVDACFVATAAYGSLLANDVEPLRRFRDVMLRSNVLGELAVETYYTFGPAVAGPVGESELLRATAREVLGPIVARVRKLAF